MTDKNKRAKRARLKAKNSRIEKQNGRNKLNIEVSPAHLKFEKMMHEQKTDPTQFFGYDRERRSDEDPFDLPQEGMSCMVSEIVEKTVQSLSLETNIEFQVGEWFVSEVIKNHEHIVHGAFSTEGEALDFGRKKLNVVEYRSAPVFDI